VALLTQARTLLWLSCGVVAASCDGSASLGQVTVWLSECHGQGDCWASASAREHFEVQGFFDPSVSRFAPNGFYAYWELPRSDGGRGLVELDVPTDGVNEAPLERYQASYRELAYTRLRFEASDVRGRLALPRSFTAQGDSDCACDDAAFALRFAEAGEDGELGTDDDRVRELTLGQLSHTDERCSRALPRLGDEAGLRVASSACGESAPPRQSSAAQPPAQAPRQTSAPSCSYADCAAGGVLLADTGSDEGCGTSTDDGSGCGDSRYADSTSSSDAGGCGDAGTSDDGTSADSGGCGDDTSQPNAGSSGSGGCEGDTSSQEHASCAVVRLRSGRRPRHGAGFSGTGLPLTLIFLWHAFRSARLRKTAREHSAMRVPLSARHER
jgi:hypothetical protein